MSINFNLGDYAANDRVSVKVDERILDEARKYVFEALTLSSYHQVEIVKVIFNDPATIVFWSDGKKTVVKCADNETFDEEKGLAIAISKRVLGNKGNYYNEFKKWLPVIETCEDKGTKSFIKRHECNSCWYFDRHPGDSPCKNCFYYSSKYESKKGN